MIKVRSKDGTGIAVDRLGDGPAVILVGGGSVDRSDNAPLAALLAEYFIVYNYDRRGRGDSDLSPAGTPYSPELEFQDLEAVFAAAGGSAYLYGVSSGAALALLAAAAGCPAKKVALYEPPYILDESSKPRPSKDNASVYRDLVAAGKRDEAFIRFVVHGVGLPAELVETWRTEPWWPKQLQLAHTLEYDAAIMGESHLPVDEVRDYTTPTLVMSGDSGWDWIEASAPALAGILKNGAHLVLEGQTHEVAPAVLVPKLREFFA